MMRAYKNNERIATAVTLKDNTILQVYPEKKTFTTMDEWKTTFTDATFVEGETISDEARMERTRQRFVAKITKHLSYPVETDTPMQRAVRQLYFQLGLRDSCHKSYDPLNSNRYYRTRLESGLSVMIPNKGIITPVYFNYTSGMVFFDDKNQTNTSLLGLTFFFTYGKELRTITPIVQNLVPGQKTIIWNSVLYLMYNSQEKILRALMDAGFYILFYKTYFRYSDMETLYKIPNMKGILSYNYAESNVNVFNQREGVYLFGHTSMDVSRFIANNP